MEINNNNSHYLHKCEDKGDNVDKRMQCENKISQSTKTLTKGFSRQKIVANSLKELIEIKAMSSEKMSEVDADVAFNDDSDESLQSDSETMTTSPETVTEISDKIAENSDKRVNESFVVQINNEMITNDSERFDSKCDDEVNEVGITASKVPLINERIETEITKTIGESEHFVIHILENNRKFN